MRAHFTAWVLLFAFTISTIGPQIRSVEAQNNQGNNSVTNRLVVPVSGTVGGVAGTLTGNFAITRFALQNGALMALGTLTATVTDATGNILRTIITPLALPVADPAGSCPVLHLELGPLDLNLLGLVVHLDKVVLDITAQSGPGNLLGNLLCAIAGLLDSNNLGQQLVSLLNQLLGALARV